VLLPIMVLALPLAFAMAWIGEAVADRAAPQRNR
jgi:hypothetical protein